MLHHWFMLAIFTVGYMRASLEVQPLSNEQLTEKVSKLTDGLEDLKATVRGLGRKLERIERRLDNVKNAFLAAESVTECPPSWIEFQSSCYGVGDANITWGAAQEICSEFDGWLVEVNSLAESDFVKQLGNSRGYERMWLGATDAFSDGHWRWTNSGRLVSEGFTDWWPGEETANSGGNQDCMSMLNTQGRGYRWYDYQCNGVAKFICEVSLA